MRKLFCLVFVLIVGLFWLYGSAAIGEAPKPADVAQQPKDLQIYLLIGQSNMAGQAEVPADAAGVLDRCYLLNDKDEWEPAKNPLNRYSTIGKNDPPAKLGPGYSFARRLLEKDKNARIGLVVNASEKSTMAEWLEKSPNVREAFRRTRVAGKSGVIKGVLWLANEGDPASADEYMTQFKTLIGDIRVKFENPNLPFVTGELRQGQPVNDALANLPGEVQATGLVSSKGLVSNDKGQFDATSQLTLGERFADQMLATQAQAAKIVPAKKQSDIPYIDVHVHAHPCTPNGLDEVAVWMKRNNIGRCIISPLDHKGSRDYTEDDRKVMLANFQKYKGTMDRMCLLEPGQVQTLDEAVKFLEKEKADGAIAMGEHYGKELMFDDPKNLMLYEACEKVGLPVMFHIDQNKNKVSPGMPEVDNVLKKYPKCTLLAHAYWWRRLRDADRQLQQYPNLYGDVSGNVVPEVLNRDRKYAREFIIRNQDKLLFGTDEGWWSFKKDPSPFKHYEFFESLDLPKEVRYKLYRGNAEKLFGWKPKP